MLNLKPYRPTSEIDARLSRQPVTESDRVTGTPGNFSWRSAASADVFSGEKEDSDVADSQHAFYRQREAPLYEPRSFGLFLSFYHA